MHPKLIFIIEKEETKLINKLKSTPRQTVSISVMKKEHWERN